MPLPPSFLDELRARTPLAALVGRRVRLARSGKNWKGCCPFHNERTPSFYVYDTGYHCFGCGAHGDAIAFVMQTGGASFPDAVAQLASEAGLEVPKPTPQAAEAERRRLDLHEVLDRAAASFRRRLLAHEGAAAMAYLRVRGVGDATIERFGLGWSGDGRGLAAELARDGADEALLLQAGLQRESENGPPREMFYGRLMFPIRDRRGRVISFGGRTLGDAKPKYVNGPETDVFQKKRTLYALDLAREWLRERKSGDLIVAEGYMDVIALHQAGFGGAVAPLGTALTSEQLEELWRLHPAPVLCFDGDDAGRRAALRAMEVALPALAPDRTLRLAMLPDNEDPDTLARRGGAPAVKAVLDAARPLGDALFAALSHGTAPSPEARAAVRARLFEAAARIADRNLAAEMRNLFWERLRGTRLSGRPAPPRPPARPTVNAGGQREERCRNLLAILLRHPALLPDVDEALHGLALPPALDRLCAGMMQWFELAEVLDSAALLAHLNASGLAAEAAQALSASPLPLAACAHPVAMPAEAEAGWWHLFGLLNRARLEQEVVAAGQAFEARADLPAQRRLIALRTALNHLSETEPAEAGL